MLTERTAPHLVLWVMILAGAGGALCGSRLAAACGIGWLLVALWVGLHIEED